MRRGGAAHVLATMALAIVGAPSVPPFQTFGRRGEFSVEDVSEPPERNEQGQVRGRQRVRWRLAPASGTATLHKTRARAFEAAADIARARGDSINDCARILAGVRW